MMRFETESMAVEAEAFRDTNTSATLFAGTIIHFHPGISPELRMMALEHVLQHWEAKVGRVRRGRYSLQYVNGEEVLFGWGLYAPGMSSCAAVVRIAFRDLEDNTITDTKETHHG